MRHPNVPESLEGWSILHRMYRFDRRRYVGAHPERQAEIEREAVAAFTHSPMRPRAMWARPRSSDTRPI